MKLSVSTLCCPTWSLEMVVQSTAAVGIGGVDFRGLGDEIDITKLPAFNEALPATLALLQKHRIEVPCLNTSITLVTPAAERWQMMLDEAHRNARLAERTHTPWLRVFGGAIPKEMSPDDGLNLARRHLRQIAKICAAFGCVPLVETHDDWSTSQAMLMLLREFDPAEVGVLWDIEHPLRQGEGPTETFTSLKRFIRHVHFKDSLKVGLRRIPKLLGEGELPLRACLNVLRAGAYDGWICLEAEKRWEADAPEPQASIPQFAKFMEENLSTDGHR